MSQQSRPTISMSDALESSLHHETSSSNTILYVVSQATFPVGGERKSSRRAQWTNCIMGKILKKVGIGKFITTALKSILKLVKVAKRCKMWKM